ncbi:MAG: family NAD(P)-dependent oxidoreductase [Mucilaginibacter sp.]|nr:family NAD(P)-dependent oxidoreductase [Mucilaginibacter sp.]
MIVITGATGKIGSKTAAELIAKGKKVKAIGREESKLEALAKKGALIAKGDMLNADFLTEAFNGAEAVLLLIPPNMQAPDVAAFQKSVGEAQLEALKNAAIKNIVFISSLGTERSANGSLVAGLADQEKRLNGLPTDVHVISLRPTGFMENLFNQIGAIKYQNAISSILKPELATGIIAIQDIAAVAADKLDRLEFKGKTSLALLGSRDYTQREIAAVIGKAIGKPDLSYVQISFEDQKKSLLQYGASESVAEAMIKMWENVNDGLSGVQRTPLNTTPTTLEYFAENVFKQFFERL